MLIAGGLALPGAASLPEDGRVSPVLGAEVYLP
jgi:hypothetical protein